MFFSKIKLEHYHTVENPECPAFSGHFNFKVCLRVKTNEEGIYLSETIKCPYYIYPNDNQEFECKYK